MPLEMLAFWGLCALAAAVHPLVLASYARLLNNRKQAIKVLSDSTAARGRQAAGGSLGGMLSDVYQQESNWRGFFVPIALCSVLSVAAVAVMMQHAGVTTPFSGTRVEQYLLAPNGTAIFGFGGAYLAGLYSVIDRFRSLTLSPFLLHLAWFRLLFGAVLGATIAYFVGTTVEVPAAFGLGFLPIRELIEWLRDAARRALGKNRRTEPQEETAWQLVQGATPDIVERLEEADVTSIAALASQNPIAMMHRTNIAWRVLIDLMDQAILIGYVGEKITPLRAAGIRGAIEAGILWAREGRLPAEQAKTIPAIAQMLQYDESHVRTLVQNLFEDAQVRLLYQLWFETSDAEETPPAGNAGAGQAQGSRVLFFVPELGVTPEMKAATMEELKRFGEVGPDSITLAPNANRDDAIAVLRHGRFTFTPTTGSAPGR